MLLPLAAITHQQACTLTRPFFCFKTPLAIEQRCPVWFGGPLKWFCLKLIVWTPPLWSIRPKTIESSECLSVELKVWGINLTLTVLQVCLSAVFSFCYDGCVLLTWSCKTFYFPFWLSKMTRIESISQISDGETFFIFTVNIQTGGSKYLTIYETQTTSNYRKNSG